MPIQWRQDVSRQVFLYDPPDRFVAGTVGLPGRRTFFLQASSGTRVRPFLVRLGDTGDFTSLVPREEPSGSDAAVGGGAGAP